MVGTTEDGSMVGTRTVAGNKPMSGLRFELVERPLGRLQAFVARTGSEEMSEIARTDIGSRHGADPRQQYLDEYRELTASPVRWVRLT
jgi:hypothetical protein